MSIEDLKSKYLKNRGYKSSWGQNSVLDSLGLVNLIVNLEENINNKFNVSISIVDEKAMSLKHSPFRNVEALADYLVDLLNEQ